MKVQHLTTISNNRTIRDTNDILPTTQEFFKLLGIKEGKLLKKIPNMPLTCRVTASDGIALFDLMLDEQLLFVNVCCFEEEKKEDCMRYVDEMASKMPFKSETITPTEPCFIYTIPVMPFAPPNILQLCGEIELYIYYELYKAWKK